MLYNVPNNEDVINKGVPADIQIGDLISAKGKINST